jgi:hypothetical protein
MSDVPRPASSSKENSSSATQKHSRPNALQTGPRKRPYVSRILHIISANCVGRTTQDPLVHHGRHFGRTVHVFCSVRMLLTNGLIMMGELEDRDLETFSEA